MLANFIPFLRGMRFKFGCWFRYRLTRLATHKALFPQGRTQVQDGPFAGMKFLNEPVWGPITPKWLGTYEAPISPCLEGIFQNPPANLIDVGCAEGYYAVGFAWKMKGTTVHAFDSDIGSTYQTRKLANINAVGDRLKSETWCSHEDITRISARGSTLVFCDIEGGEQFLLDPETCPALRKCRILVEIHLLNGSMDEMSSLLKRRFGSSHEILRIDDSTRRLADFPKLQGRISESLFTTAADECRPNPQHWLWMEPKFPN